MGRLLENRFGCLPFHDWFKKRVSWQSTRNTQKCSIWTLCIAPSLPSGEVFATKNTKKIKKKNKNLIIDLKTNSHTNFNFKHLPSKYVVLGI